MDGLKCPQCGAVHIVKNGHAHTVKQRYLSRVCTHQFALHHRRARISPEMVALVDRLPSTHLSHRRICRAGGVSRSWFRRHLQFLMNSVPHCIDPDRAVTPKV